MYLYVTHDVPDAFVGVFFVKNLYALIIFYHVNTQHETIKNNELL